MTTPSFPLLLAYEIFYIEAGQVYHLPGEKKRIPLTEAEYNAKILDYRETKTEYMLLYDYMFVLKKDKWEALPSEINIDEVEFYYQLSILNDEDYMKLKYLYSEYGNKKN
ncbi:hypothetical protein [Paenibacillus taichungensis]